MESMHVHQFLIIEWIILNEKWLRSCEEFDSLSENRSDQASAHFSSFNQIF